MDHHIYIGNKRRKNISDLYPDAIFLDVTSKSVDEWVKFSPFFPHGNIPVLFSPDANACSVEGIWQGLKVFEKEGIDESKFFISDMKNIKRSVQKHGKVLGHQKGVSCKTLLGYKEAKELIYLPSYKWVLEANLRNEIDELRSLITSNDIVLLDYETNENIYNDKPLSHAFLIKLYLENKYPV